MAFRILARVGFIKQQMDNLLTLGGAEAFPAGPRFLHNEMLMGIM